MQQETILFALDFDQEEVGTTVGRSNWSRLDVIKHAITNFVHAKRWCCAAHKYGLITVQQDTCSLHPLGVTSNVDRFLESLQALQPREEQQTQPSCKKPFDLGSLITACQPFLQQQQQSAAPCSAAPQRMHGGVLTPLSNSSNSSSSKSTSSCGWSSSEPQAAALRVVLIYCRSALPAPVWRSNVGAGLAVDCLHVHDKPQPGQQQQELQEVYSTLETLVDKMAVARGHASLIYETSGGNLSKMQSCVTMMLSHPAQRPPQALAQPPTDLAAADLQPLPSDAANLSSGVPIMSPGQLPPVAAGAWSRPLSAAPVGARAAGDGSATPAAPSASWLELNNVVDSSRQPVMGAVGAAAAAAVAPVVGLPAGCVQGVPDDAAGSAWALGEGVAVGIDAGTVPGSSSAVALQQVTPGVTAAADEGLEGLAESLQVSAIEESSDVASAYPKII